MARDVFFVFDLDDTLYPEVQYSLSALNFIGSELSKEFGLANAAQELTELFKSGAADAIGTYWRQVKLPIEDLKPRVAAMQSHNPAISLYSDTRVFLEKIKESKIPYALVTDGRSVTQRQKISALGLSEAVAVCISEETGASKPDPVAFEPLLELIGNQHPIFVGDNPSKDFAYPNSQGWTTVMRRNDGTHIREQVLPDDASYHSDRVIDDFSELGRLI